MSPTAEQIKARLGLEPHPTCGFVRESWRGPGGSVLYFLVTPDARMALHRIRPDQMYHHYLGDALQVLLLYEDGTGEVVTVGHDLATGMAPQLLIPSNTWHVSRLGAGGEYALLATTEWPAVQPQDVELADAAELAARYPDQAEAIRDFAGAAGEAGALRTG